MNRPLSILYLITSLVFSSWSSYSQTKKQPLEQVLGQIEEKYKVSFSYVDHTIENITLEFRNEEKSIGSVLSYLESSTNLRFRRLADGRFITITKKPKKNHSVVYEELEEVQISNYLTSGISKNNEGGITIKPKKLAILPGLIEPDILQTIQALPGVFGINEDVSNLSIRGGTPDQNLVLYDGIRMYQTGHFFGLISAFNPYLTKKIAVFRHGTQAKYGEGISSVIQMELADNKENQLKAGAGFNLISTDGFAVMPLSKKLSLQIAARRSITDVVNTPTYNQYFKRVFQDSDLTNGGDATISKNENFYFNDIAFKFLYDPSEKDKLRFNFLQINNSLSYQEETIKNASNQSFDSNLQQKSLALGLTYERQWTNRLNTFVQLHYSTYDLNSVNFNVLRNQRLLQQNKVLDDGLKVNVNYSNSNFSVNTGVQFSQIAITSIEDINNPSFRRLLKNVIDTYSTYGEVKYNSTNKNTSVRLGVRHNFVKKFDVHLLEPRFFASKKLWRHFRIDLSGEMKSQTTSQIIDSQQDFLGIEKRRWVLTDNDLIPIIKSQQATLGLAYKQNNLLVNADFFVKKVTGITTKSQGFQNQFQFVNSVGDYQVRGLDFLINKQFSNFNTWLSYSISTNKYNFENFEEDPIFLNNFDVNHVVNFSNTYTLNNLKLALGINWNSAKPVTQPNRETPVLNNSIEFQKPNSRRLPTYLRTDFSCTYKFQLKKTKALVGMSIWNILDRKNTINTYYQINNGRADQVNNQALGITPNLSFRLMF